jgi:hypothetical protein
MNQCIGYAKPGNWIPAAQNERITGGGKGKIGVGKQRQGPPNSQFCCNFATLVKSIVSRCIDGSEGLNIAAFSRRDSPSSRTFS